MRNFYAIFCNISPTFASVMMPLFLHKTLIFRYCTAPPNALPLHPKYQDTKIKFRIIISG